MIKVTNLVKKYGKYTAVNDISFNVKKGEILGFLGPNGAGKSTTMNMLTGYLSSTSGSIKINDIDILENPLEAKKHIGYLPEIPPLYNDMTVNEYLNFVAKLKKVPKASIKDHIKEILEQVSLTHMQARLIKNLSKGYKQRVGLACALMGSPDVLILDEPTVGLDPMQIIEMRNLIKELSSKHTIILSSHILPEISAICNYIMIINKGEMVAFDSPDNLKYLFSNNRRTVIAVKNCDDSFIEALNAIEGVENIQLEEGSEENTTELIISYNKEMDIRETLFNVCAAHNHPLLMMKSEDVSLEDIFLKVTTDANEPPTDDNTDDNTVITNEATSKDLAETTLEKEGLSNEDNLN